MTDQLLGYLLAYGVPALMLILFFASIGVPLPGSLLLLAAGAFSSAGQLPLVPLLLGSIVATVAGNGVGYWLGRRGEEAATARWGARLRLSAASLDRAQGYFARNGGLAVLFSRFPLSPLAAIINIIAGATRYSLRPFLLLNLVGTAVWAAVYIALGYAFGANWELLVDLTTNATWALTLLVVGGLLLYLLIRTLRGRHGHDEAEEPDPGEGDAPREAVGALGGESGPGAALPGPPPPTGR